LSSCRLLQRAEFRNAVQLSRWAAENSKSSDANVVKYTGGVVDRNGQNVV